MTQAEFTKLTGFEADEQEWETITNVYNWHPAIPEVNGKAKLAELFKLGKMGLLRDMEPTALNVKSIEDRMHELDEAIRNMQHQKGELQAQKQELAHTYVDSRY